MGETPLSGPRWRAQLRLSARKPVRIFPVSFHADSVSLAQGARRSIDATPSNQTCRLSELWRRQGSKCLAIDIQNRDYRRLATMKGPKLKIHSTSVVSSRARIHDDVEVGPYTIIHDNVEIGEGAKIGSHCELGVPTPLGDGGPLYIGPHSLIRSHSIFYESSRFGERLTTGHRVTVREKSYFGSGVQIGTLCDIQGHCTFGDYVRLHSSVFVAQHTRVEDFVWLLPRVSILNDPHPPSDVVLGVTIHRFAAISASSTILPGVTVGEGALVGAGSCVTKDVAAHRVVRGNPARDSGPTAAIKLRDGSSGDAYPWISHFHRGYPAHIVQSWQEQRSLDS